MVKQSLRIGNQSGLHLRPAGQLCQKALEYQSTVHMVIGEKDYNLKSVLSVLSAQVTCPTDIELVCSGADEEKALKEIGVFLAEEK